MSQFATWALLIQLATTLAMVGLIWFVQVVHYPLFSRVGESEFKQYEVDHQRLTTLVVGPLMLLELASAAFLVWENPTAISSGIVWSGLLLLLSIWAVTYAVQVPQHMILTEAYDAAVQKKLVLGNWYRTIAWSARGGLLLFAVSQVIKP